ncbi:unnamed protein product [Phytophthora fragariaefolia]|uniref:Unnamed protein product n=1 Tax=Phytophthora fragariaefolia TaxID=1490495 RepID=A0A9W6U7Y8_9STRA|nr:unnamed protein product [Phytophthora fragariaefolia]
MGMHEGLRATQAHGVTDLVVVGDSRLAIQESLGVIACLKESLLTQVNVHRKLEVRFQSVRYLHVTREYHASVDSLAVETLAAMEANRELTEESKSKLVQLKRIRKVIYGESSREVTQVSTIRTLSEDTATQPDNFFDFALKPSADDVDPLEVQEDQRRRVGKDQDEELRWDNLKLVLKGESSSLGYKAAREAWEMADRFVLSDDGLLHYLGENRRWGKDRMIEKVLRRVAPTTMVQEVLQSCHDALEGGHQVVVRNFHRVKADYYSIGLYAAVERHVRPCPDCSSIKSHPQLRGYSPGNILASGHSRLCQWIRHPTTEVSEGQHSSVAISKVGALFLVRHDRDPRFMSEVFQAFAEMMQSRSRATLCYRPQANGQQRHSEETPFYLVHGCDAQSTLKAMASSLKRGFGRQSDALAWRREVNRQQEIALKVAKEYQAVKKAKRASEHNNSLSRKEKRIYLDRGLTGALKTAQKTQRIRMHQWTRVRGLSLNLAIECGCTWKESC